MKTVVFETAFPGGQIVSASWVENYPGFPDGVSGADLGDLMAKQAENAGAEFHNLSPVEAIRRNGEDFVLTVDGKEIDARVVILATGAIPKKLGIPGEADFTGRGVSWCATCDGPLYRGKTVAVIGGGDSATQEALYLAKIADQVHLIHRREELRATQCLQDECFFHPQIDHASLLQRLGDHRGERQGGRAAPGLEGGRQRESAAGGRRVRVRRASTPRASW